MQEQLTFEELTTIANALRAKVNFFQNEVKKANEIVDSFESTQSLKSDNATVKLRNDYNDIITVLNILINDTEEYAHYLDTVIKVYSSVDKELEGVWKHAASQISGLMHV